MHKQFVSKGSALWRWAFSEEEEASIVARIRAGETKKDIVKSLGIGMKPIERIITKYNLHPQKIQHIQLEGEKMDEIIQRYCEEGWSLMRLAKHYSIWIPRLRQALIQKNVKIRPQTTAKERVNAIIHDYIHSGLDTEALCRKHKITDKVVRRLVKERGLVRLVRPTVTTAYQRRNGKTCYEWWVQEHGKEEADRRDKIMRQKQRVNATGRNNNMYGRPTPQGAGNGWKGWYKGTFFRSLRELFFMVDVLEKETVQWESGELSKYEVEYIDPLGQPRTYRPDYVADQVMYEIKPKRLWDTPTVTAKRVAAEQKCQELGLTYQLVDPPIDSKRLMAMHLRGDIKWWKDSGSRFLEYHGRTVEPC